MSKSLVSTPYISTLDCKTSLIVSVVGPSQGSDTAAERTCQVADLIRAGEAGEANAILLTRTHGPVEGRNSIEVQRILSPSDVVESVSIGQVDHSCSLEDLESRGRGSRGRGSLNLTPRLIRRLISPSQRDGQVSGLAGLRFQIRRSQR